MPWRRGSGTSPYDPLQHSPGTYWGTAKLEERMEGWSRPFLEVLRGGSAVY